MNKKWVIGVSTPYEFLNDEYFEQYNQNGIGSFELSVEALDYNKLDFKKVSELAKRHKVDTWSFHLPFYLLDNVCIDVVSEELRKKSVDFQSEQIKKAADVGFKNIVVHPSYEPILSENRKKHFNSSKKSIEELAKVCSQENVVLAVENLPRTCLANTSIELLNLVEGIENAKICFDVNHLLCEDHLDFLNNIKEKLVTLHLSDYDYIDERHWLPGEGKINWKELISGLESVNYNGPLMYEINRGSTPTILRDNPVSPSEFAINASQLINGLPLTKRGKTLV